jgi:peptidoglycan hydrolase CwlO-like protein
MLITVNNLTVDTDYLEDHARDIRSMLPFELADSVEDKLTELREMRSELRDAQDELEEESDRLTEAREARDTAQDMIKKLQATIAKNLKNIDADDLVAALEEIHSELDNA